jgi:hypothetical protein
MLGFNDAQRGLPHARMLAMRVEVEDGHPTVDDFWKRHQKYHAQMKAAVDNGSGAVDCGQEMG